MAAPNIVNVSTITAKTAYTTPASTSATVLLANAASSGKVFKVNVCLAANVNGSNNITTTIALNSNAAGSGTSYPIASTISVPPTATISVIDKSTAIYLEEDRSIVVTSGTANGITYTVSYEEIS